MGNWTHAEIQALNWLNQPGTRTGTYTITIDRPFCRQCATSVPDLVDMLAQKGIHVEIRIQNKDGTLTDPLKKESPHGKGHTGCP